MKLMVVLNFSHPVTPAQQEQIETLTGLAIARLIDVALQMDNSRPFAQQVGALADATGLTPEEWQNSALLVNPPGYAPAAVCLLAEIHGRSGHFPAIVRIRPGAGSMPTLYEVAEILDLQGMRDDARKQRQQSLPAQERRTAGP